MSEFKVGDDVWVRGTVKRVTPDGPYVAVSDGTVPQDKFPVVFPAPTGVRPLTFGPVDPEEVLSEVITAARKMYQPHGSTDVNLSAMCAMQSAAKDLAEIQERLR